MEFPRVSPESVGVPSQAVLDLLDELYRYGIEMHSFMLLRHGKVFAQGHWKPYNPQTPHAMFSFTKSLTSTAIALPYRRGCSPWMTGWWTSSRTRSRRNPARTCKSARCATC